MSEVIRLCKIAVDFVNYDEERDGSLVTLRRKGKLWRPLPFVQSSESKLQCLQKVVNGCYNERFGVDEINQDGRKWLALYFKSKKTKLWWGKLYMPVEIYETLFYNDGRSWDIKRNRTSRKCVTTALFNALDRKYMTFAGSGDLQLPACFLPKLCQYQRKTVVWLCQRERQRTKIPSFYEKLRARDNETIVYAHKFCLHILDMEPEEAWLPRGGILADEMGLGKTVEMLALILLNTRRDFNNSQILSIIENKLCGPKRSRLSAAFCLCTSSVLRKVRDENIQCNNCELWQHKSCVCRYDGEHDKAINEPYVCPQCWNDIVHKKQQLVPSRATIIITPNTIKLQWLAEIHKHINPSISVFVYDGLVQNVWISPRQLADHDVVLTDYNVLRKEFYHTADNDSDRVTRNKPRRMRCNTPLLMVEWWRACLDEAQTVESNFGNVTKLALQLPALNRWAVTGTPIQNFIDDLHNLLLFIGFAPICCPHVWDNLAAESVNEIGENGSSLFLLLLQCMWRTCKTKVEKELNIPLQKEEVHYLKLSNLEKLFYSEEHAACEKAFNENFENYVNRATSTSEISPQVMRIFLEPLLKIRQCCTIPVVVSGAAKKCSSCSTKGSSGHAKFLQPKDLHAHLKTSNETECKTELRTMASCYNGIAGIFFLLKQYAEAIRYYELVLKLARDYDGLNITVDSLLQIHALHNILQAYYTAPDNGNLLPDGATSKFEEQCNKLEWRYLETYASRMQRVREAFETEHKVFHEGATHNRMDLVAFVGALTEVIAADNDSLHIPIMQKIEEECVRPFSNYAVMQEVTSIHSALYVITTWHDKCLKLGAELIEKFRKLEFFAKNIKSRSQVSAAVWRDMMQFVNKVSDCHLRGIRSQRKVIDGKESQCGERKQKAPLCDLCDIRNTLKSYECLLFNKETNITEGLTIPSPQIILIKAIFNFTKSKLKFQSFASGFDRHWEHIECKQTMCKKMWKYWIEIEYTVKAYDELDMCKMRISFAQSVEERSNFNLLESEVEGMLAQQQSVFHTAQLSFSVKFARLKYILHLEKNADPGACPICHSEDEPRYAVLECGHHICLVCLKAVKQFYKNQKLTCSICRNQQNSNKLYYVTRTSDQDAPEFDIKGDYSSKVSFIVQQVLKLQKEETQGSPTKIIIFSKWEPILTAIAAALNENNISYRLKWSPKSIEEFKNPDLGITCMLMAISRGSKGLNLIEANHVFLVEPILNPAEELQAIGRVDRFGQTRQTTVHRFIVLNTIEENIYYTVTRGKETASKWDFDKMDLKDLRNLFHLENDVVHCF